jgi:hypothetical protein
MSNGILLATINAKWINNRTIEGLCTRNITRQASLDMPNLAGLPPQSDVVTGPLAYIRLHVYWAKSASSCL